MQTEALTKVGVRADSGLDAVYDDLAKRAYDTCTAQATDKPMRRACGILQEVVWDCWNGHVRVREDLIDLTRCRSKSSSRAWSFLALK